MAKVIQRDLDIQQKFKEKTQQYPTKTSSAFSHEQQQPLVYQHFDHCRGQPRLQVHSQDPQQCLPHTQPSLLLYEAGQTPRTWNIGDRICQQ